MARSLASHAVRQEAAPPVLIDSTVLFLLPFVVYVLHTLEELPGFAAWATRHFGPESTGMFAAYHIPLMLLVLLCSWQARRARRHGGWVVMATAFQWQFAVNAVFHLTSWIILGDYAPGAVTGAVVSLPATALYLSWICREARATTREIGLALALGTLIAALAIGFLFL
ncbi:HXXEE domain-containing protein [Actinomadura sp. 6N118]|uniref:HXXEE domain-containing protein n=1 Tax=Actinomadura sp. 6N118 TaxID=3375151 RepID=UPI0037ADB55E